VERTTRPVVADAARLLAFAEPPVETATVSLLEPFKRSTKAMRLASASDEPELRSGTSDAARIECVSTI
jgi:hypothetical protein